jgi:cytochrome c oxidase cbb3-type subunit 2
LTDPRSIVPLSVMPGYPALAKTEVNPDDIEAHLRTNRAIGVPYTDEQIANARADLLAQVDPDSANADAFQKRYPKAAVRNFDGRSGNPTELDALIAYLQMLGTLVDFKLYDDKANLR